MAKKINQIIVSFKYSENGDAPNSIDVIFPQITFEGDDLKGRRRNSDQWWFDFAIDTYNEVKGKNVRGKDFAIMRV